MNDKEKKIVEILQSFNDEIPTDIGMNLLAGGYIDSFDIVNIVADIEETFNIEIIPEKIVPENFENVKQMTKLVEEMELNHE